MINVMEKTQANLVAVQLGKKLDAGDYDKLNQLASGAQEKGKSPCLYIEMGTVSGRPVWDDKFDFKYLSGFGKVAMVGDEEWVRRMQLLGKRFGKSDVQFFSSNEKQEAENWLQMEKRDIHDEPLIIW